MRTAPQKQNCVGMLTIVILITSICFSCKAEDVSTLLSQYDVIWNSPSNDCTGSMPIGNGDMGLNVWFEKSGDLLVYISKGDAWNENGCILKLGKLRITFSPNPYKDEYFHQELVLANGEIIIKAGQPENSFNLRIWVDAHRPVAFIECESRETLAITVKSENWRTQKRELKGAELDSEKGLSGGSEPVIVDPDVIVDTKNSLTWYHRNVRSIWSQSLKLQGLGACVSKMHDPLMDLTFGCCVKGKNLVSSDKTTLKTLESVKSSVISISALTAQTKSETQWLEVIENLNTSIDKEVKSAYKQHVKWWGDFWDRSWIFVNGNKDANTVTQGYLLARWLDACAGRGKYPIKFNGSIFTVDADTSLISPKGNKYDADYRLWGSAYWWQNTRLVYWPMLHSGDFDLMQPLFNMYMDALPLAKERTQLYYNHSGVFFPETFYFWGTYINGDYGWDRQGRPLGLADNPWIRYYWQGGIELVAMMLEYHEYTNDDSFARTKLIPMSDQILLFYAQHWKRDDSGKILFKPAASLETWHVATNPLPEIAGLKFVLNKLLNLKSDLIESHRGEWQQLLESLPPVPLRNEGGMHGKKFLLPAEAFESKNNMENPELYAVFPYRLYGMGKPDLDIARETYIRRQTKASGCWFQDAIDAACLGLSDEAWRYVVYNFGTKHAAYVGASGDNLAEAIRNYGSKVDPNYRFPGFWGPNYDWIPDQDQPGVTMIALQRMLMQTDGGKILLFPAWPRNLDVEFKLHAPYNTVIEASLKNGKVVNLKVEPAARKNDVSLCLQ
jgi:alpha-L-fucosidase 2